MSPASPSRNKTAGKEKPPVVSKRDYEHLAAFRNALRDFLHFSEEAALAFGVPPQQHQAMLAIRGAPDRDHLAVGELASQLKIKHNSAVGLVNRMEAEGLVHKSRDAINRRQVLVRLTARGARALEKLSPAHMEELARVGPSLRKMVRQLERAS